MENCPKIFFLKETVLSKNKNAGFGLHSVPITSKRTELIVALEYCTRMSCGGSVSFARLPVFTENRSLLN